MSYQVIFTQGTQTVTIPATESIVVQSYSSASVFQLAGTPNIPNSQTLLGVVKDATRVFGPFATGAVITIQAGASEVNFAVGTAPTVSSDGRYQVQRTETTLNATGTLTGALLLNGIVTSTSAAAVTATLETGALLELASDFVNDDSFNWNFINTGPSTVTIAASAGHTFVGAANILTTISGQYRTRRTALNTFITYRIG